MPLPTTPACRPSRLYPVLLSWLRRGALLLLLLPGLARAANPVLSITGLNLSGGDNTAFVDNVQIYTSAGVLVTGAVVNGSFENFTSLGNTNYGYNPAGASWTFTASSGANGSGIAQNGSAFSPTATSYGSYVAFVQGTGSLTQTLTLGTGGYYVSFQVSQRNCCSTTTNQRLLISIDGVAIGVVQPTVAAGNVTYTSSVFDVGPLTISATSPTPNTSASSRGAGVSVTFDRTLSTGSASALKVFSAQRGGLRTNSTAATVSGSTLTFTPSAYDFQPGELVQATVTTTAQSSAGAALASPLVWQFRAPTTAGPGTFGAKTDFATAATPQGIALGDVNGDGKLDMVTASRSANSVSVLLGTGTGSFGTSTDYAIGGNSPNLTLGDMNGDGKLDIVTANYSSNTVSVLLGTGTGSFGVKTDYATGNGPFGVALGDVNGDGQLDIVTANNNTSGNVSVLLGTGTGTFGTNTDYAGGSFPLGVTLGDLNGDGLLDIVATNNGPSGTASVLLGTGAGSFGSSASYSTGGNPYSVALGDLNGDGKLDLVTANNSSSTTSVLLGTGTGAFGTKTDYATGARGNSVTLGDVNGDGKLDIAKVNYSTNSVSVLLGTGTGTFGAKTDYVTGSQPYGVTLGDVDGDGRLDIATANSGSSNASVLLGLPPAPTITSFTPTSGPVGTPVAITGTNLTGATTITFTGTSGNTVTSGFTVASSTSITGIAVPSGAQTGTLTVTTPSGTSAASSQTFTVVQAPLISSFSPARGAIGSSVTITGSGFSPTAGQNIVFFGATQATVTAASATSLTVRVPSGATYQYLSVTNLAAGLTGYSSQPFLVSLNGAIAFQPKTDLSTPFPNMVSIGDLDGDGKPDLTVTNGVSNVVSVLRNTSTAGTISFAAKVDFATGNPSDGVSMGDVDGDGKLDLVTNNSVNSLASVSVLRNTSTVGTISFATKVDVLTGSNVNFSSIKVGDLDGDGKPDLAMRSNIYSGGTYTYAISVLRNLSTVGTLSFAARVDYSFVTPISSLSIGDLDGDGKPDLAVTSSSSSTVSVLRNTSTVGTLSFATKVDYPTGTNPFGGDIGDLDGDGKPELAVANPGSNTVSVLRNMSTAGTISFAGKVDFPVTGAYFVAITDLDGDGKPDLATANVANGVNTASVLRNLSTVGTLSFATKADFTTATQPFSVSIGDLDGDSKPDMVTASPNYNTISILRQRVLLTGLSLSTGTLSPAFDNATLSYTAMVGTASLTITPTASDPAASILVNGNAVLSGSASGTIALTVGSNAIPVVLDGVSYTVTITRMPPPVISSFTPTSGPRGTTIAITGTDLTGATTITFTGTSGNTVTSGFTVASATSITGIVVPSGAQTGTLTVTTPGGTSAASTQIFTLTFNITAVSPTANVIASSRSANVSVTFDQPLSAGSASALKVFSSQRGGLRTASTAATVSGSTLTFTPSAYDFQPGELVQATVTTTAQSSAGASLAAPRVWQFRAPTTAGSGTFGAVTNYATGSISRSTELGDVNNDGKLDLVSANYNSSSVSVLLGTGTGTFGAKTDYATGSNPADVALGDVNGDGSLDIVVANYVGNSVSVLLGAGTGSFGAKTDYVVGSYPSAVVLGDVNGDGSLDIAVTNTLGNSVSVLLGTGTGSFGVNTDYPTGAQPYGLALSDVNGDGNLDVVTGNNATVSVLLGLGTGSFSAKTDYSTPTNTVSPTLGDVNGDGKLDILASDSNTSSLSLLLGTGTGTFGSRTAVSVPSFVNGLTLGDVNGDGALDIVTGHNSSSISVQLGTGSGSFGASTTYATGTGYRTVEAALGDLNGDGRLDIATVNFGTSASSVLLGLPPVPTVTSLSPSSELPGMPVTITGTGFTAASTVKFGGVAATSVTYNSATSLTAVVPAGASAGSSTVVVSTASGSSLSAPAFTVLSVYSGTASCASTTPYVATGDGAWHYLLTTSGEVIAALQDTRAALGSVTVSYQVAGSSGAVRQDGGGRRYLDRNFQLTASGGTFVGSTVNVRFYGLTSEFARLQAVDAAVSYGNLNVTQYSGGNEDCSLANDNFRSGELRVLPATASTPGNGENWFVAQLAVPDHFSEFYLTSSPTPLPVELAAFTAERVGETVQLSWRTASEKNNDHFEVERSMDGKVFEQIGLVKGQGSKASPTDYRFLDNQLTTTPPHQLTYYRLKQVDQDDSFSYSLVRTVNFTHSLIHAFTVYPNPARGMATVAGLPPGAEVQVLDALGRVVGTATADASGVAPLPLTGLPAGVYVVRSGTQARRLTVQ